MTSQASSNLFRHFSTFRAPSIVSYRTALRAFHTAPFSTPAHQPAPLHVRSALTQSYSSVSRTAAAESARRVPATSHAPSKPPHPSCYTAAAIPSLSIQLERQNPRNRPLSGNERAFKVHLERHPTLTLGAWKWSLLQCPLADAGRIVIRSCGFWQLLYNLRQTKISIPVSWWWIALLPTALIIDHLMMVGLTKQNCGRCGRERDPDDWYYALLDMPPCEIFCSACSKVLETEGLWMERLRGGARGECQQASRQHGPVELRFCCDRCAL